MNHGDRTALLIGALLGVLVVAWGFFPALKEMKK